MTDDIYAGLKEEVVRLLVSQEYPSASGVSESQHHNLVVSAALSTLSFAGFACQKEYPVPYRIGGGKERAGRVDLFGDRDGFIVGVEVDYNTPKPKSVVKLMSGCFSMRVVILHGSRPVERSSIPVDAIIDSGRRPNCGALKAALVPWGGPELNQFHNVSQRKKKKYAKTLASINDTIRRMNSLRRTTHEIVETPPKGVVAWEGWNGG